MKTLYLLAATAIFGCGTLMAQGPSGGGVQNPSSGGGGATSVSNSDGTLTISPTTGAVVASLALGNANTWTATQTFAPSSTSTSAATFTLPSGSGATAITAWYNNATLEAYINSTGTVFAQNFTFMAATACLTGQSGAAQFCMSSAGEFAQTSPAGNVPLTVRSLSASPTNDLLDIALNTSTIVAKFDKAGNLTTPAVIAGGTKFTATGCTSITSTVGGATAGKFTIGANSCTVVITMNGATGLTAPNGYSCHANDETTAAGNTGLLFLINNATTATLTVPVTAAASDVIDFGCNPF